MKTDDLIVELVRSGGPVQPLSSPQVRLARWAIRAFLITAISVLVIGPRSDAMAILRQPAFAGNAAATVMTALMAAFCALVLSIPGVERSRAERLLPFAAAAGWISILLWSLQAGGDWTSRLLALPIHSLCIIEIALLGVIPGWTLFTMVRNAAPLQPTWTAAFATLAAVGFGAAGTQVLCPVDDPAHHLVSHVLPVFLFTAGGAFLLRSTLDWIRR